MINVTLWVLAISTFSFVLGFVALLSSKIYLDKSTRSKTEIELPILGKMQTNYPALVFVLVGAALAAFAVSKHFDIEKDQLTKSLDWTISGNIAAPPGVVDDFREGAQLVVLPTISPPPQIWKDGRFEIHVSIPDGKTFESEFAGLMYTNQNGSAQILAEKELKSREHDLSSSHLSIQGRQTRVYKDVPFEVQQ